MDNSKKYQRQIVIFIEGIDGIKRHEFVHGTLYLKLEEDRDCDFIHTEIRKFYKGYVDPEGGVNMYAVGDEFAFDFVEGNKDNYHSEEKGVWSEFAEDEMLDNMDDEDESPAFPSYNEMPSDVDIALNLESDSKEGR